MPMEKFEDVPRFESEKEEKMTVHGSEKEKYQYDALVVLGAVMKYNENLGRWDFPTIIEEYSGKLVMGKARALAAKEIQDLAPVLLVTGGSDVNPKTKVRESRAVELSKLLTEKFDVPAEKVEVIGSIAASNTLGNAENVAEYLKSHPGILKTRRVGILSPRFQQERARMIFDQHPYFKEENIALDWLVVEDILEKKSPRYKKWAEAVYKTPEAEINRQMEEKGIRDLKSGKYQPKTPPSPEAKS